MSKRRSVMLLAACGTAVLAVGAPFVLGQTAPTENVGVNVRLVGALDLGPEIDTVAGRQLRLRTVTIAAGGVLAPHSHADRPSVELVLSGEAIEFRGETPTTYREGDAVITGKDVTHWWRNDSNAPVVIVAADVFHPTP